MKKTIENRYPHSATLFKFCKEALEIRYDGNVKVIDQDVGSILGYDPADCSHWKKGKKNIHALAILRSIAEHLNLDERLLIDIASGKIDIHEALFEYKGYGSFTLKGSDLENLKKDFFKNPEKWQNENNAKTFEELFDLNRSRVIQLATQVLKSGDFKEAPIYIPEIYQLFPGLNLIQDHNLEKPFQLDIQGEENELKLTLKLKDSEMRPYMRFLAAKNLFNYLSKTKSELNANFTEGLPAEVREIQSNIFAGILLIPKDLLKKEVERLDGTMDIVSQLAEIFWVSKALMNQRLSDYMTYHE